MMLTEEMPKSLSTLAALNPLTSSSYTFTPGWFRRYASAACLEASTAATIRNLASRRNPALSPPAPQKRSSTVNDLIVFRSVIAW